MGYKLLGFVVWKGARFYLKRKLASSGPSRPVLAAGVVGATVAVLVVAQSRRDSSAS